MGTFGCWKNLGKGELEKIKILILKFHFLGHVGRRKLQPLSKENVAILLLELSFSPSIFLCCKPYKVVTK